MTAIIQEDILRIIHSAIPWKKFADCTVLITGATSMLGSYMAYTLAEIQRLHPEFHLRLILGCRNREKARAMFGDTLARPDVLLWQADMSAMFTCEQRADYIVHTAGLASSHLFLSAPVQVILPNVIGTWQLLEKARRDGARGVLFFSSGAVYGNLGKKNQVSEQDDGVLPPMELRNCYAESKRMGENLCAAYAAQYHVPAASVRISHTFGPTMDLNDTRVFSEFVRNIIRGENIVMKSDGSAKRSFCYISDATTAFFLILLSDSYGVAYNMCNNKNTCSIYELAHTLCRLFPERNLKVIRQTRSRDDPYSEDRSATAPVVDCSRLHRLGWTPGIDLAEGFRRTVISFEEQIK